MLFFSQATPNLAIVIPAMDHIDHQLQTFAQDQKYLLSVRAAISLARKTLNHYYLLMDNSKVYQIAMSEHLSSMTVNLLTAHPSIVLHPHHKLTYFKNMDWEANWISTAERLVQSKFKTSYMAIQHIDNLEDMEDNCNKCANKKSNIFDSLLALAPPKVSNLGSELDHYLSTDMEHVTYAIGWWHECCHTYPSLSHMALNYLTVPGMYLSFFILSAFMALY